jgi:hypothetical protein
VANDTAIVTSVSQHVTAALNRADASIALVTAAHRTLLLHELRAQGVKLDDVLRRGTFALFDADVAPDPVQFAGASRYRTQGRREGGNPRPRIAFCGERAGRLWPRPNVRGGAARAILRRLTPATVDILCVYPVPYTTGDEAIACLCAEHTAVASL